MTTSDPCHSLAQRLIQGELQGYLSLSLTALLLAIAITPLAPTVLGTALGLATLALIVVFGIRGASYRQGGGRVAAWASLVVVSLTMIASVVIVSIGTLREMDANR